MQSLTLDAQDGSYACWVRMDGSSSLPTGLKPEDVSRRERIAAFYGKLNNTHSTNC
jgi:hypothetical protein